MLPHLRASLASFRAHPGLSIGLGAAVVVSLCSVCAGIGLVIAPWFVCELFALQLEARGKVVRPRGRSWILACLVVVGMVLVVASAGWLAALGFGPDVSTADNATAPLPWPETLRRLGLIALAMGLAVAFTAPFLHAPLVLLHRGGRLGGALLESAALMRAEGTLSHFFISLWAQVACLSPALLSAMVVARTMERAATPVGIVAALPLLPLSIPLGLGLVTSAYVAREGSLGDPRRARRGPPVRLLTRSLLVIDVVAPLLGLSLVGASALLPLGPLEGPADGTELERVAVAHTATLYVPDTSLAIEVSGRRVSIVAGHEEPLALSSPWSGEVTGLRVTALQSRYGVEVAADGRTFHVEVDGAGVRVDDSVRRRLRGRMSGWLFAIFLLGFGLVGVGTPIAFGGEGAARVARATGREPPEGARSSSLRVALLLFPVALVTMSVGALAFFSG